MANRDPRFEQLINGLVYELFFPEDLYRANIHLFAVAEKAGIDTLVSRGDHRVKHVNGEVGS